MSGGLESDERIVQALRLPVRLTLPPACSVPSDTVDELVMSDILRALIWITAARSGSADQREPDGVVVRLIRSVFAIGQDCSAKLAAHVGQVNPLVRRHFELLGLCRGPFDRANVPVIRSHLIRSCQRESRFQI